ncbi:MAG: hypothetical protein RLZZ515_2552, partial [Cyanobacteriota bacterium]
WPAAAQEEVEAVEARLTALNAAHKSLQEKLEAAEKERSGISTLKVGFNSVFGLACLGHVFGWAPMVLLPLAIWQSRPGRRLWTLLLTDVGFGLGLMLLATAVYVPLFFTRVVWFFPFALLPRGLISAGATRLLHWRRQGEL